jgi:hypothetical protein
MACADGQSMCVIFEPAAFVLLWRRGSRLVCYHTKPSCVLCSCNLLCVAAVLLTCVVLCCAAASLCLLCLCRLLPALLHLLTLRLFHPSHLQ